LSQIQKLSGTRPRAGIFTSSERDLVSGFYSELKHPTITPKRLKRALILHPALKATDFECHISWKPEVGFSGMGRGDGRLLFFTPCKSLAKGIKQYNLALNTATKIQNTPTMVLGKRTSRDEVIAWSPSMDLENADAQTRRTAQLFMELQNTVHDCLRWRHAKDAKHRHISAKIAASHPLTFTEEVPATSHDANEITLPVTKKMRVEPVLSFEEKMKMDVLEAKARAENARSLPAPLTHQALSAAYKELPSGAEQSIETVIQCWRTDKLGAEDVIATAKSFAGSSATLRDLFSADADCGEVASADQMRELAQLAAICC
jgi:hypothetical protein